MQKQKPVATKFAGANPFQINSAPQRKMVDFLNVEELTITNDVIPHRRSMPIGKYNGIFEKMAPGQCIRCKTESVGKVCGAMRKFILLKELSLHVKSVIRYDGDEGYGRIWMLKKDGK